MDKTTKRMIGKDKVIGGAHSRYWANVAQSSLDCQTSVMFHGVKFDPN